MAAISVGFMTRLGSMALPVPSEGTEKSPSAELSAATVADSISAKNAVAQNALHGALVYFLTAQAL